MTESGLNRVAVALDTSDWDELVRWSELFGPRVGALKVGLEAFVRWGPKAVETVRARARKLFLDLKLHDIPTTVAGAVGSARAAGVDLLTVHAGGGSAMLRAAAEASGGEISILAVTVLTHLDHPSLSELGLEGEPDDIVVRWSAVAREAGCSGVVCSARELPVLRGLQPPPFLLVTPGIRPAGSAVGDQRRVATPGEAVRAGADLMVIGRPLTRATNPSAALTALAEEIAAAEGG